VQYVIGFFVDQRCHGSLDMEKAIVGGQIVYAHSGADGEIARHPPAPKPSKK
jgi:hypothetical protein